MGMETTLALISACVAAAALTAAIEEYRLHTIRVALKWERRAREEWQGYAQSLKNRAAEDATWSDSQMNTAHFYREYELESGEREIPTPPPLDEADTLQAEEFDDITKRFTVTAEQLRHCMRGREV